MMDWIYSQMDKYLDFLPEIIRRIIEESGIDAALDATLLFTEAYTPKHYIEEMRGISDGAGVDFYNLYRINLFPELIRGLFSLFVFFFFSFCFSVY